jgi:nuclear transport factor 2 (NTF2) superfamily protein
MYMQTGSKSPLLLFDTDAAVRKVRLAEDAWYSRDPERFSLTDTIDSIWRNRSEFTNGCDQIISFLQRK